MAEITLTTDNFEQEVINSEVPVLVDFWASWCGPCKMLSPVVSELAEEYDGKIKVGKVNVDEQMPLAEKYMISSIPAVKLFAGGKEVGQSIGFVPKANLVELIKDYI